MSTPDKIARLIIKEHAAALRRGFTGKPTYGPLHLSDGARDRILLAIRKDMHGYDRYQEILSAREESNVPDEDWEFAIEFETTAKSYRQQAEREMAEWAAMTLEHEYDNTAWGVGYETEFEK